MRASRTPRGKQVVQAASSAAGLHPLARRAFDCLVNPSRVSQVYYPGVNARHSLKVKARTRFNVGIAAGKSSLIMIVPQAANDKTSIVHYSLYDIMESVTGSLDTIGASGTKNSYQFQTLPFSTEQLRDGIGYKCIAVTVKITYIGPHLSRSGTAVQYESLERPLTDANTSTSQTTALNAYMPDLITSPNHARYCNFASEPVHEFVFHPFMWGRRNESEDNWWHCDDSSGAYSPCYPYAESSVDFMVGNGFIYLENDHSTDTLSFQLEFTADYEYAGGAATQLSTPSPSAPADALNHVVQAVRQTKRAHCLDPHAPLAKVAGNLLKEGVAAAVGHSKAGKGPLSSATVSNTATLAAGIAGLLL